MDRLEFDLTWLENWVNTAVITDHAPEYRRLLICMCAYENRRPGGPGVDFALVMLPTDGPYDSAIRNIARAVRAHDMAHSRPKLRSPSKQSNETFGFVRKTKTWRLQLELSIECPRYPLASNETLIDMKP